ncbi:glycosyltransferase family 2 protein [Winogradskyella schleiferi]|uniref:glycosyltransferase family 2 protein n=1 Tax=Winogradskyella schleiferi TaxID=2686078 RepID=UPI0015C01FCC|nr:glycosyltransferase family 2 protein [Winogradskyella schleiferi]
MGKVTFLMPVYNGEKYLREAIDSILAQTYTNFELLIINDGSTDNTQQIIDSYSDPRIKCVQQQNCGVAKSLNNGLALITTKYIRRHDADDISEPNMLEVQMQFLQKHKEIKFVSTSCAFMTNHSKVAYNYTQPKSALFSEEDYVMVSRQMFNPYSPIVHGTVLGPTAIFKEMNGYREAFLTSEDNDLWLRIIEHYKFAVLKHSYYYLRLNATSATQVHKASTSFYRDLTMQFAREREIHGTDLLQRGETMPKPKTLEVAPLNNTNAVNGKIFRGDILHFGYKINLDAKDYKNILTDIKLALRDGWKLKKTWKAIIFPILGDNYVKAGVKVKQKLR